MYEHLIHTEVKRQSGDKDHCHTLLLPARVEGVGDLAMKFHRPGCLSTDTRIDESFLDGLI